MDEARRFIRYVIPTLVIFSEYVIFLVVSLLFAAEPATVFGGLLNLLKEVRIPGIFSGLLVLTGFGVIISNIYHFTFLIAGVGSHYKELFRVLKESKSLVFIDISSKKLINIRDITPLGRWRIVDALWHSNKGISKAFELNCSRTEGLCDIAHSLGTTFIGSIFGFFAWFFTFEYICQHYNFSSSKISFILLLIVFFVLILLKYVATRTVSENAQSVISQIILSEIKYNSEIHKTIYLTRLEHKNLFKRNAEKEEGKEVMKKIGETAGSIYEYLKKYGESSDLKLKKDLELPYNLVDMGIGWLSREGKLSFKQEGKNLKVSLL